MAKAAALVEAIERHEWKAALLMAHTAANSLVEASSLDPFAVPLEVRCQVKAAAKDVGGRAQPLPAEGLAGAPPFRSAANGSPRVLHYVAAAAFSSLNALFAEGRHYPLL